MTHVRSGIALAIMLLAAPAARAQFGRGGFGFSVAAGVSAPIGDLDKDAQTGFGIAVRTESGAGDSPWGFRGGLTFDRFGGKAAPGIDNLQFITFPLDVVHNTNKQLYQFVGVGLYQAKTVYVADPQFAGTRNSTSAFTENDFGFQGGVGYNFGKKGARTFVEFEVVDVLTSGRSSVWFPIRFGIRL